MCDSDRQTVGTREKSACASETASERARERALVSLVYSRRVEYVRDRERERYTYLCRDR